MKTELVSIPTDTVTLEGAYYEPDDGEIRAAALLFHGNCMNFYVGPPRFLPPALTRMGIACLAFNRRGHDVLSTRDSRELEGGAFQTTAEAVADNRFAAAWLAERGHADPVIIGHSHGGMLAVRHAADQPKSRALVLLSAHAGGRGIAALMSERGLWAADRLDAVEREARAHMQAGNPRELMILPGWWRVITAESALDVLAYVPDIVALAPRIGCPVLYLRGDEEPARLYPAEAFAARCGGRCDVAIVEDCGHFYVGRETEVASRVARWLAVVLGTSPAS